MFILYTCLCLIFPKWSTTLFLVNESSFLKVNIKAEFKKVPKLSKLRHTHTHLQEG